MLFLFVEVLSGVVTVLAQKNLAWYAKNLHDHPMIRNRHHTSLVRNLYDLVTSMDFELLHLLPILCDW